MPTYEYACTKCGQHVEVFQRLSEPSLSTCGVCGGPLRKVFHPAGIVFKGSGFYATDNRAKPKTKTPSEPKGESKPTSEPKGDSTTSSEPKGEPKPSGEKAGTGSPAGTGSAKEKSA
ncbi:MAG TPA: FmdB family zinc ribbon protein [Actinomycetota bacterium]